MYDHNYAYNSDLYHDMFHIISIDRTDACYQELTNQPNNNSTSSNTGHFFQGTTDTAPDPIQDMQLSDRKVRCTEQMANGIKSVTSLINNLFACIWNTAPPSPERAAFLTSIEGDDKGTSATLSNDHKSIQLASDTISKRNSLRPYEFEEISQQYHVFLPSSSELETVKSTAELLKDFSIYLSFSSAQSDPDIFYECIENNAPNKTLPIRSNVTETVIENARAPDNAKEKLKQPTSMPDVFLTRVSDSKSFIEFYLGNNVNISAFDMLMTIATQFNNMIPSDKCDIWEFVDISPKNNTHKIEKDGSLTETTKRETRRKDNAIICDTGRIDSEGILQITISSKAVKDFGVSSFIADRCDMIVNFNAGKLKVDISSNSSFISTIISGQTPWLSLFTPSSVKEQISSAIQNIELVRNQVAKEIETCISAEVARLSAKGRTLASGPAIPTDTSNKAKSLLGEGVDL